jgi:hypothetical protein
MCCCMEEASVRIVQPCSRALVNRKWLGHTKTRMEGSPFPLFFYSCKNLISASVKSKIKSQRHLRDTDYTVCTIAPIECVSVCPTYHFLNLHHIPALGLCIPQLLFSRELE